MKPFGTNVISKVFALIISNNRMENVKKPVNFEKTEKSQKILIEICNFNEKLEPFIYRKDCLPENCEKSENLEPLGKK